MTFWFIFIWPIMNCAKLLVTHIDEGQLSQGNIPIRAIIGPVCSKLSKDSNSIRPNPVLLHLMLLHIVLHHKHQQHQLSVPIWPSARRILDYNNPGGAKEVLPPTRLRNGEIGETRLDWLCIGGGGDVELFVYFRRWGLYYIHMCYSSLLLSFRRNPRP